MQQIYHKYTKGNFSRKLIIYFDSFNQNYLFHYMLTRKSNPSVHLRKLGVKPKRIILKELRLSFESLNADFKSYPFFDLINFKENEMKTLAQYQQQLLAAKNLKIKNDGYGESFYLTADDLDANELLDLWLADHPQPEITDHNDPEQALLAALWILQKDDFLNEVDGDGVCTPAIQHKERIKDAIDKRCSHCTTAWQAAYLYTESRRIDSAHTGLDQEG